MGGIWLGSIRLGDWATVKLVLQSMSVRAFERKNLREGALQRNVVGVTVASNEFIPCLTAFTNNIGGISGSGMSANSHGGELDRHCSLLVLAFTRECKLVLRLSIWYLVDAEPLVGSPQEARKMALDILNI